MKHKNFIPTDRLLNIKQALTMLPSMSRTTLWIKSNAGLIPGARKDGGGRFKYSEKGLLEYIADGI